MLSRRFVAEVVAKVVSLAKQRFGGERIRSQVSNGYADCEIDEGCLVHKFVTNQEAT